MCERLIVESSVRYLWMKFCWACPVSFTVASLPTGSHGWLSHLQLDCVPFPSVFRECHLARSQVCFGEVSRWDRKTVLTFTFLSWLFSCTYCYSVSTAVENPACDSEEEFSASVCAPVCRGLQNSALGGNTKYWKRHFWSWKEVFLLRGEVKRLRDNLQLYHDGINWYV